MLMMMMEEGSREMCTYLHKFPLCLPHCRYISLFCLQTNNTCVCFEKISLAHIHAHKMNTQRRIFYFISSLQSSPLISSSSTCSSTTTLLYDGIHTYIYSHSVDAMCLSNTIIIRHIYTHTRTHTLKAMRMTSRKQRCLRSFSSAFRRIMNGIQDNATLW